MKVRAKKALIAVGLLVFSFSFLKPQTSAPDVKIKTATGYYNRALAEFSYQNVQTAIDNLTKAIELRPDYADALSYRGYFYHLNNQNEKSINDYLAANKIKNNINGYFIAVPYALTGKKDEAFKWLEMAFTGPENKPSMAAVMNDKELESLHSDARWTALIKKEWFSEYEKLINDGNNKTNANDLAAALEIWNKAVALDPKQAAAYDARAINYLRQGNAEKAVKDLTEAIKLKPENSSYYGNRAYMYKELKKYTEALADYNKAIELDPQNMIYAERAMVKEKLNSKDASVADDFKTHLDAFYKDDFYAFFLGSNYFLNNNMPDAITYLSNAIAIKGEAEYYKLRGKAYFINKNFEKALTDFDVAVSLKPEDGEAWYFRGTTRGEQRNRDGACADWRKAVSLGYQDSNGYINSICK
ncbi:MAG: tetratricopeptide repeat protein [Bacteroidia bacterium]|nr:tetratricopeptide repeat protein [Bacteroidia bacterium]